MTKYRDLVVHEGNQPLIDALEMSILSLIAGKPIHVHVEGLRGTGKTTVVRAMRSILPLIERVTGCMYNCEPDNPHCPIHKNLGFQDLTLIGTESIPIPFLEISHAAKIGTVVGSVDLGKVIDQNQPEVALLPGIIPRAYRGIIFVDEINRLADTSPELTDVLLDVMGTKPGHIQIEETGLPALTLPIICSVWAASNPDEEPGALEDIRRQLSDRFDFVVSMGRPQNHNTVKKILAGCKASHDSKGLRHEDFMSQRSGLLRHIKLSDELASLLAELYVSFGIESLRAVEAISLGARARAALNSRTKVSLDDVKGVLAFTLRHRVDSSTLISIGKFLDEYESRHRNGVEQRGQGADLGKGPDDGQVCPDGSRESMGCNDNPQKQDSLWDRLMRGIGLVRSDVSRLTHDPCEENFTSETGRSEADGNCGASYVAGGGTGIADPKDVNLCSPHARAKSLLQLAGRDILFSEEDLRIK